jgi:SAM-dependent methyltransferase
MYQIIRELWNSEKSYFIKCGKCGFGFGYPHVGGNEKFYDILHESPGYPSWKWDYDYALGLLEGLKKEEVRILDIGAGSGMFLEKLKSNYLKYAVEGGETTRSILRKKNINVLLLSDLKSGKYQNFFDVLTMFQVLEHIADFDSLLSDCSKVLKTGGRIIITVPLCEAMINQELYLKAPDMPPNHINKWSPESLTYILKKYHFQINKIQRQPSSFKFLLGALHLKIMGEASKGSPIAGRVYSIKNKQLRILSMALVAPYYLAQLLPHLSKFKSGGSFSIIAIKQAV